MSASLVGKWRSPVPTPTPACRATSSIWASSPSCATVSRAALSTRSRLSSVSARRGRVTAVDKRNRDSVILEPEFEFRFYPGAPMPSTSSSDRRRWIAVILLCAAQFVVVLDASIVNVALPSIGRALHFSEQNLQWVVNAYVLVFGGFLLLGGRMADLLGRRRVFMGGLVLFGLASLAGGLASSEGMLIAARAVQGLGGAILSPAALSIVTTTFEEGSDRNKALGIWGAVAGSGR